MRPKRTRKYHPTKYYKGLSSTQKAKRYKEIQHFGKLPWTETKAYKGFSTDKGVKTKTSSYVQQLTRKFKRMGLNPNNIKSLKAKSKATGVPLRYLTECYNRGMAAWRTGHRPGATEQQWGYARVASLLVCGKTAHGPDADIVRRAKRHSIKARRWWQHCPG
jgi:Family of unknown function (DUF5824)